MIYLAEGLFVFFLLSPIMEHLDGTEIMNYFYMNNVFSKIVF